MSEEDPELTPVILSPPQIISAVRNMEKEQHESFLEDLLAAVNPEYLESIREARAVYRADPAHDDAFGLSKCPVTLYQDEEGWYVVECSIIPACLSQGRTEQEALQNIREAIQRCLEVRRQQGLPPTIRSLDVELPAHA